MSVSVIQRSMCGIMGIYETRFVSELLWDLSQTQSQNQFGTYYRRNEISVWLIICAISKSVWDLLQTQYEDQFRTSYRRNTKIRLGHITGAKPNQFRTYYRRNTKISLRLITDPIRRSVWDLLETQYEDQFGTYYRLNTKISLGLITDSIRRSVWDLLQTQYED